MPRYFLRGIIRRKPTIFPRLRIHHDLHAFAEGIDGLKDIVLTPPHQARNLVVTALFDLPDQKILRCRRLRKFLGRQSRRPLQRVEAGHDPAIQRRTRLVMEADGERLAEPGFARTSSFKPGHPQRRGNTQQSGSEHRARCPHRAAVSGGRRMNRR